MVTAATLGNQVRSLSARRPRPGLAGFQRRDRQRPANLPGVVVVPAGYCRGVETLDWDSAKRPLRRTAEINRAAAVAEKLKVGGRTALNASAERTAHVMAAAQALLASDLSSDLNNLVAAAVKGSATSYDRAMDANYLDPLLRPGLGGSYHRLSMGATPSPTPPSTGSCTTPTSS